MPASQMDAVNVDSQHKHGSVEYSAFIFVDDGLWIPADSLQVLAIYHSVKLAGRMLGACIDLLQSC